MKQPNIVNGSRLHILRVTAQTAPADERGNPGAFGPETVHAYIYPTQDIFLPVSTFAKFFIEAQPIEKSVKAAASVDVHNAGTQPVRVRTYSATKVRESDAPVGAAQFAGFSLSDGQRLEIAIR